jgi:nucleoside-diphosphate-sugar epimerase
MMRIAITGASGFIGQHVTARFAARGDEVRAIVRRTWRGPVPAGVAIVPAPLERASLGDAFTGVDAVVHLAGVLSTRDEEEYSRVNVDGSRAAAEAARDAGARFVHVSSLAAAGPAPAHAPHGEHDRPRPLTAYGRSKLESERAVASVEGLRWTILRPGVVYGPGDRQLLPLFQLAARGVIPRIGRADAAYTFVHVRDMVRAAEAAVLRGADGTLAFVGHPAPVTIKEIVDSLAAATRRRPIILPIPLMLTRAASVVGEGAGRMIRRPLPLNRSRFQELAAEGFVCRVDTLRDALGVTAAVRLLDGFVETAEWYRAHQWL